MKYGLLIALGFAVAMFCGCASQHRVSKVGSDTESRPSGAARLATRYSYDFQAPSVEVIFKSKPEGALIEWRNDDDNWVALGPTPSEDVLIEATGKPELFRISHSGYMSQSRWVSTIPSAKAVEVHVVLEKDLAPDRLGLGMSGMPR